MENSKIILFEEDETSLNYMFEKLSDRLKSTEILSIEYDKDEFLKNYTIKGQPPEIGSVYYKHPTEPKCYVNSGDYNEYVFMKEKIEAYGKVAQLLGAISFEATVVLDSIQQIVFEKNGDIKYKVIEMNASLKESETKKIMQKLELKRDFEIQLDFNKVTSFNEATKYIESHNFSSDPSLKGLLDSRNPKSGTVTKKQTLKTELTSEYNNLLEFSANLNVMKGVFKLNMGFSEKFESIKKVNLDMTINF